MTSLVGGEAAVRPSRIDVPEDLSRRRLLGIAAMTFAAAQLAMIGCAKEQSSKET